MATKTSNSKKNNKKTSQEKIMEKIQDEETRKALAIRAIQKKFQENLDAIRELQEENNKYEKEIKDYLFKKIVKNHFDFTNPITDGACLAFIAYTRVIENFKNNNDVIISPLEMNKIEKCFQEIMEAKMPLKSNSNISGKENTNLPQAQKDEVIEKPPIAPSQDNITNSDFKEEEKSETIENSTANEENSSTDSNPYQNEEQNSSQSINETPSSDSNDVIEFPSARNNEEAIDSNIFTH